MRSLGEESGVLTPVHLVTSGRTAPPRGGPTVDAGPRGRVRGELAVCLFAAVVFAWSIGAPSAWWDEAVTREVVQRPVSQLFALAGHVDLVHLTYYLLAHAVWLLVGSPADSATVYLLLRGVSAVASVLTAFTLIRIGRALGSKPVGLTAGLLFAVSPVVSRYAQEARPYALATLTATAATLALLHALRSGGRSRWALYSGLLLATGLLNEIALLVLMAHLAVVAVVPPGRSSPPSASAPIPLRTWAAAVGVPLLVLLPFLYATSRQSAQVGWLPRPTLDALIRYFRVQWESPTLIGGLVLVLVALSLAGRRGRLPASVGSPHRAALLIGLVWAIGPPLLLWAVSQAEPLFVIRYLVFAMPGAALLLASGATVFSGTAGRSFVVPAGLVVVLAVIGLHAQHVYRDPERGHAEDLRSIGQVIDTQARRGDAVLFITAQRRVVELGYPEFFGKVEDVALDRARTKDTDLFGVDLTPPRLAAALAQTDRVWLIGGDARSGDVLSPSDLEKQRALAEDFVRKSHVTSAHFEVSLYVRKAPPRSS